MNNKSKNLKNDIIMLIFSFVQDGDIEHISKAKVRLIEFAKLYKITINKVRKSEGDLSLHFGNFVCNKIGFVNSIEPFYQVLNSIK